VNKHICLILFFLICHQLFAQQNRIKLGFIGFPSQSGFGIGNIGYERFNDELSSSWQLHINGSGGAIGNDVGTETRKWVTVERTFYKETISEAITWSYSFFLEAGNRIKKDEGRNPIPAKEFIERKLIELNPGISLGVQLRIGKKWGIESQAGPKVIFATGKNYYYNRSINQYFTENTNGIKAGFRFMGAIYFQF
jgi:hypothetical protein